MASLAAAIAFAPSNSTLCARIDVSAPPKAVCAAVDAGQLRRDLARAAAGVVGRADRDARFRPDDPDALVRASLVCPFCLGSAQVEWEGTFEGYDPSIRCECGPCQQQWSVYLAPEQALRLGLMHAHAG